MARTKELFASILQGVGLSQAEAAELLGVRLDTVKSWGAGRNRAPAGVLEDLRTLATRQETMAARLEASWDEAGRPEDFPVPPPPPDWSEASYTAAVRRAWERMPAGVRFVLAD